MLVTRQVHGHLLTPCYRPVPEVAREEIGGEGVTQMHRKRLFKWRQVIVKCFRGGNWKCPLLLSSFMSGCLVL